MNVLIACEWSGTVRDAFRRRGHEAWSCDLLGPDDLPDEFRAQQWPNYHLEGDVRWFLDGTAAGSPCSRWDLLIAFPPCTYLCSSGLHWNTRRPGRARKTEKALAFVRALMRAPIARKAIENPRGCIGTRIRPATQSIQPYQFGENASKETCLWLENLPPLRPTAHIPGRNVVMPNGRKVVRWGNQTDSGQNKLAPSEDRARIRGRTYAGIAEAMAHQWGKLA